MEIKQLKRPWEKKKYNYSSDPYYQTSVWKELRQQHRNGQTEVNGKRISNVFCIECFKESGRLVMGATADHITARKDGGTDTLDNLQTLCDSHDGRKRAIERQNRGKGGTNEI